VGTCTNYFTTEEKAKDIEVSLSSTSLSLSLSHAHVVNSPPGCLSGVQAFFAAHPVPAAERRVKQSLERIRSNAAFLAREGDALARHFASSQQ
jgi:hypothetical protein